MSDVLFHYCSNQTFASIVQNKSVWLSSLSLSNDRLEGRWLRELISKCCLENEIGTEEIGEIMYSLDKLLDISDALGFCLSEDGDLLSQWRGYADDGSGVSVGFSRLPLEQGIPNDDEGNVPGVRLVKLRYEEVEQRELIADFISGVKKRATEGHFSKIDMAEDTDEWRQKRLVAWIEMIPILTQFFAVKNPAFCEEREWRLISQVVIGSEEKKLFRAEKDRLIPFRSYRLEDWEGPILTQVTLGPRNRSKISDVADMLKSNGFSNVEIHISSASYR